MLPTKAISLPPFGNSLTVSSPAVRPAALGAVPACGMGLNYMLETLPLSDVLGKVLGGSGECAEKGWELLGLSDRLDVRVQLQVHKYIWSPTTRGV